MCDEKEVLFYGMTLWNYYDNTMSSNSLNFDYYTFDKDDRLASPRFKISIIGKAVQGAKLALSNCELYKFSYQLKSKMLKNIKTLIDKVKTDQGYTEGFVFHGYKKNIYVTGMWSSVSNEPVIRFMIAEKEQTVLESDKVYIPIVEFFSFCEILNQAFNGYLNLCASVAQENSLKKLYDMLEQKSFDVEIPKIEVPVAGSNSVLMESKPVNVEPEKVLELDTDIKVDEKSEKVVTEPVSSEIVENQSSFDSFLKENRDNFSLDLPGETDTRIETRPDEGSKKTSELDNIPSKFIQKLCEGDLTKLEELITNVCNQELPFDSFIEQIKTATGIDFRTSISSKDYIALNYAITRNLKFNINQLLEKQVRLPASIAPVVVTSNDRTDDKVDVMYQLLLLYIYISKVRTALSDKTKNSLDNKEFFAYVLKTISNPLVFTYLHDTPVDVIKSEVIRRYFDLKKEGFFDQFHTVIKTKIPGAEFSISEDEINESIDKIMTNVTKFKDKLNPGVLFNSSYMKLSYSDIQDNDFTLDSLKKIICFDWSLFKYGKVDVTSLNIVSTDDIPVSILRLYGINTVKFDNTILLKYFKDNYKNFSDLEKIKKINRNVYDILDDIDLEKYDDNQLKALYFWDTEELPKTLTAIQFKQLIEKSSLERSQLLSMIINRNKVVDPTFFNSFLVSAEDPFNS